MNLAEIFKLKAALCPIFGTCGGCQHQDIPYSEELALKENDLRELFVKKFAFPDGVFEKIVPSPKQYHYRSRMDLKLIRTRQRDVFIGFSPEGQNLIIPAESCAIAMEPISDFFPELRRQAIPKLTEKYRNANLVVKTGDDGRVFWGGIGRRSLQMNPQDYLWTDVLGKRIFYSLDTFFQANLSILPALIKRLSAFAFLNKETALYDLYGGVGLFGVCLYEKVKKVVLVEENLCAAKLAAYNVAFHGLKEFEVVAQRTESYLVGLGQTKEALARVAIVDPPRDGLTQDACRLLSEESIFQHIFYLSCHPESLARDLAIFAAKGWEIEKVMPFDFFPRTKHLETLVLLGR
jgi:tRNA/tmRNA/rRNA uracil-C5-methylase (TrmA/RlmC/RlmD family)